MLSFNEIMIDFGGSENYAEHYYANGNKDFMERGYFYQFFADNYLNQFSYHLKETPKGNVYANVIILPNNQFYLVRLQHKYHYLRYYADKPRQEGTYKIKKQNKQKLLELNFNTGKTEYFVCQKLKCIKRTNHSNH